MCVCECVCGCWTEYSGCNVAIHTFSYGKGSWNFTVILEYTLSQHISLSKGQESTETMRAWLVSFLVPLLSFSLHLEGESMILRG